MFKIKDKINLETDLKKYGFEINTTYNVLCCGHPSDDASYIEIDLQTRDIYINEYENDGYKVNTLLQMAIDGLIEEV